MVLAKQFVRASITELRANVWEVKVVYSYYSLYTYEVIHIADSLNAAMRWLLEERCGESLQIINAQNVNI